MRFEVRLPKTVLLVFLFSMVHAADGAHAVEGALIERTLVFVNRKPLLLSDIELTRALLHLDEKEALERTIDESLMFEEASKLLGESPPEEAVARAVRALQEKAETPFSVPALRRKALVQLAISNYIELRLRPLVRVEDEQVRRVFNEKVARDLQPPIFQEVAPAIRESLERRSIDQKIEEWVAALRIRAEIRRPIPRP